jgi:hypothetical protein
MSKIILEVDFDLPSINAAVSKLTLIANAINGNGDITNVGGSDTSTTPVATLNLVPNQVATQTSKPQAGVTRTATDSLPELDNAEMPWDARIHSGAKSKTTNGIWKKKKGVKPEEFDKIADEIMGKSALPDDEYDDEEEDADLVFGDKVEVPNKLAIEQTAGTGPMTFQELMGKATKAMTDEFIDFDSVTVILQLHPGTNGLPAKHLGMLAGVEYKDCISPVSVALSQHVHLCGGTW